MKMGFDAQQVERQTGMDRLAGDIRQSVFARTKRLSGRARAVDALRFRIVSKPSRAS